MSSKKYQDLIKSSGGFTKSDGRRGDRPQPLSKSDEETFSKAWNKVAEKQQIMNESSKHKDNKAA